MEEIGKTTGLPLVLHGGTGIPTADIKRAISLGTAKINVNTENQIASAKAVRETLAAKQKSMIHVNILDQLVTQLKRLLSAKCVNLVLLTKHNLMRTESRLSHRRFFHILRKRNQIYISDNLLIGEWHSYVIFRRHSEYRRHQRGTRAWHFSWRDNKP